MDEVLKIGEATGLRDTVIVHTVRKMHDGGKKKTKKSQVTELSSSERDVVMTGIVDKTDPQKNEQVGGHERA